MACDSKRSVTVTLIHVILILEYCSAQNQNLIERNVNTISDRTFQNTVLSRRPVTNTINNAIGQGSNSPRIRLLSFSNPQRTSNNAQINNALQLLRLRAGQQTDGVSQQGTRRMVPTAQQGGMQQQDGLGTNQRLIALGTARDETARQAAAAPAGQSLTTQQLNNLLRNQRQLALGATRSDVTGQISAAPTGQLQGAQQFGGLRTNQGQITLGGAQGRATGQIVTANTGQLDGTQQLGGLQANQRQIVLGANQDVASLIPNNQLLGAQRIGGLQTNQGQLTLGNARGRVTGQNAGTPTGLNRGPQQVGLQTNERRVVLGAARGGIPQQSSNEPNVQVRSTQQVGGLRTNQGQFVGGATGIGAATGQAAATVTGQLRSTPLGGLQVNQRRVLAGAASGQQLGASQPMLQANQRRITLGATRTRGVGQTPTVSTGGVTSQLNMAQQLGGLQTNPRLVGTGFQRGGASRRVVFVSPTGTQQLGNISSLTDPGQTDLRRASAEQLMRLVNRRQQQQPRSPTQFRPGPLTRDPRTGLMVQRLLARTSRRNSNLLPLGPVPRCQTNMTYICQSLRRIQDRPRARRCVGTCATGRCLGLCVCACVPRILLDQSIRRINTIQRLQGQTGVSGRSAQNNRASTRQSPNDLNFTIDNSILARLLAEPDLNMLVGPEGINQILRGEPPTLLSRQSMERQQNNVTGSRNGTANTAGSTVIDMGIPIPQGPSRSRLTANPLFANMLTSGERFREMSKEIRTEMLGPAMPALTEFHRPNVNAINVSNNMSPGDRQLMPASSLDASFLGAIVPMPRPISLSRDRHRSRDRTHVVVNPSLLVSGVVEPVGRLVSPRNRFRSLRSRAEALENVFDANAPFETISDVLSGSNAAAAAAAAAGAFSRDPRFLENIMKTSGNQEPSDVTIMAAMMQTLGGAVDAVSAANSRNNSAGTGMSRGASGTKSDVRGQPAKPVNQTSGNFIENFLTGTVKSTDHGMSIPTAEECFAQGRELWCDPYGIWENTPGLTRWCLMNCRSPTSANICDQNRCDCKCVDSETYRRNMNGHSM